MLVLSRHRDQSIIIGDDIVITVVAIRGDKVRLGISAPLSTEVHRAEVHRAIQAQKRADAEQAEADRQRWTERRLEAARQRAARDGLPSQARPPSEPEPER